MGLEMNVFSAQKAEALPAPCHRACPAGIDIPSYLALVAHGRYEEALEVIRQDNPFPWVCGLICPHPCEKACIRRHLDEAVNIRYLKAFVAEWAAEHAGYPFPKPMSSDGTKVAVVGSGPAGLSAAHYLALKGYQVTIFEALPIAGGLLMVGIPEYRLPREIVRKEIAAIESMGVEIRTGVMVGRDITFDQLRAEGFKAFFMGVGAHRGFKLEIEGEQELPQVYCAIALLRRGNLEAKRRPADKVVVVGGGNSAMDAARTCLRLGCKEVHVAYRRTREEMPANPHEVREAMEEGVQFHFLAVPIKIVGSNGQVSYLECLQAELGESDASGRRRPIPVQGSNFRIEAGAVITAIGQQPDFRGLSDALPFEIDRRNRIITGPSSTCTSVPDIFAGGDAVTGPATVVEAIAAGKQAALDIVHYLSGETGKSPVFRPMRHGKVPPVIIPAHEKVNAGRVPLSYVDPEVRKNNFAPVELGYSQESAQREALRCLRCDMCIRCGSCEKVCREGVQVSALEFKDIGPSERILCNYDKPGKRCITCGTCAIACPTGAIELIEEDGRREVRICGTVLNRLEALRCESCGEPFVPQKYLDYVVRRSDEPEAKRIHRTLCPKCARQKRAHDLVKL